MKYTLKQIGEENILHKNDKPCVCPWRNPIVVPQQSKLGQMSIQVQHLTCSDACALFVEKDKLVELNCGNVLQQIKIETNEKNDSGVLRMFER